MSKRIFQKMKITVNILVPTTNANIPFCDPAYEVNHEMIQDCTPALNPARPFLSDVPDSQVQGFHQGIVGRVI
ncbi:hypothetical protein SAMN02745176_03222 [Lutispora thermophila DSM 19022]|uniref:Uncharacterized protein n=1 Tax=Lutispora thermophila DSM 19022 TaxID=1122184 RepID=A0A1M6IEZ9_9FIRM|nr:hypothetical protein SAMN02745176_03222 [Lutispora thermophila DSM 19022]